MPRGGGQREANDGGDRGGAGASGEGEGEGEGEGPPMPELPGFFWDAAQGRYFRAPGRGSRGARSRAEQHAAFRQQLQLQQREARPAKAKSKAKAKAKGRRRGRYAGDALGGPLARREAGADGGQGPGPRRRLAAAMERAHVLAHSSGLYDALGPRPAERLQGGANSALRQLASTAGEPLPVFLAASRRGPMTGIVLEPAREADQRDRRDPFRHEGEAADFGRCPGARVRGRVFQVDFGPVREQGVVVAVHQVRVEDWGRHLLVLGGSGVKLADGPGETVATGSCLTLVDIGDALNGLETELREDRRTGGGDPRTHNRWDWAWRAGIQSSLGLEGLTQRRGGPLNLGTLGEMNRVVRHGAHELNLRRTGRGGNGVSVPLPIHVDLRDCAVWDRAAAPGSVLTAEKAFTRTSTRSSDAGGVRLLRLGRGRLAANETVCRWEAPRGVMAVELLGGAGAGPESPHAFCVGLEGGALLVGDVRSPALTKRGKMARTVCSLERLPGSEHHVLACDVAGGMNVVDLRASRSLCSLAGHKGDGTPFRPAVTPAFGGCACARDARGQLQVWSLRNGRKKPLLRHPSFGISRAADEFHAACGGEFGPSTVRWYLGRDARPAGILVGDDSTVYATSLRPMEAFA